MIPRIYRCAGKEVVVLELDDLVAVRASGLVTPDSRWPSELQDPRAFERAGWRLVPRSEAQADPTRAQVVQRGDHTLLAPNRLSVKFRDDMPWEIIGLVFERMGLTVLQRLTFAHNLFVVASKDGGDVEVFGLATNLDNVQGCEFAEPDLLEILTGR